MILALHTSLNAAEKSGVLSNNETWSGTIEMTGSVKVPQGITLNITAGTLIVVKANSSIQLLIEGILNSNGTKSNPVVFKGELYNNSYSQWEGIKFRNTINNSSDSSGWISGSKIEGTKVSNAYNGIYVYNQGLYAKECEFSYNTRAIELRKTDGVYIKESIFHDNNADIMTEIEPYGSVDTFGEIKNTWFIGNTFYNQGISLVPNQRPIANLNAIANKFINCQLNLGDGGYGFKLQTGDGWSSSSASTTIQVTGNTFKGSSSGITLNVYSVRQDSKFNIKDNTFAKNQRAISMRNGSYGSCFTIEHNFFYQNAYCVWGMPQATSIADNLLFQNQNVFYFLNNYGGNTGLATQIEKNNIQSNNGIILFTEGNSVASQAVLFKNNIIQNHSAASEWFVNKCPVPFTFQSNYIELGNKSILDVILDGNDIFDYGVVTFQSTLTRIQDSTSTRTASEIPNLLVNADFTTVSLNYDNTKGVVNIEPNQEFYDVGQLITVSAQPQSGYIFAAWGGDINSLLAIYTLTLDASKTIFAQFVQDDADSDSDGLSNYQELTFYNSDPNDSDTNNDSIQDGQAVQLGYSPNLNLSSIINYLIANPPLGLHTKAEYDQNRINGKNDVIDSPNSFSLYTTSQIQNMAFGDLVLTKNANGSFTLNYDIEQSTDLQNWSTYAPLSTPLTGLPADKAFVRIKAKQ